MKAEKIRLDDVSKVYQLFDTPSDRLKEALHPFGRSYHRDFEALKNVSFSVGHNEIVGIIGKNGCGKSTLLKLIANVLQPTSGTISVNEPVTPLLELGAGLNPEYSGIENIFFFGNILGLEKDHIGQLQSDIVEFADIGEHINQPLKTYSSGMKSRLGFAIAAHVEPQILIVDEVLAVGDIAFQRKCYRRMEQLFSKGSTVLYVSHNMQSVVQLCSRALLLHDGELVMDDLPDCVIKEYQRLLFQDNTGANHKDVSGNKEAKPCQEKALEKPAIHPDLYVEGLKSFPVETNAEITQLSGFRIKDKSGYRVNQLNQGESYCILFTCAFLKDVSSISFGCQIMNIEGIVITGANMLDNQGETFQIAKKGDSIRVKCEFKCLLVPGPYVLKIFSAPEDGTPPSIVEDAMMFQVRPGIRKNGGYVFLEQKITATRL